MIDVIIPAYNSHSTIDGTLASIAYQSCVSWLNVYIVNDCSDFDYSEFVDFYSNFMSIKELKLNINCGPGVARQYGVDSSNSDYIVFIDSDDVFADCDAVKRLYDCFVRSNSDIAMSTFTEECDGEFVIHEAAYVWLHGKIFKREFLKRNEIRFNQSRKNEDCGFNQLCYLCDADYFELDNSTYIWRNNKNSITRTEENFNQKNVDSYLFNMIWAIKEALKRNFNKYRIAVNVFITFVSAYHYYLQTKEDSIVFQLAEIVQYLDIYLLDDSMKTIIIKNQLLSNFYGEDVHCIFDPFITLEEFILMIKKEVVK